MGGKIMALQFKTFLSSYESTQHWDISEKKVSKKWLLKIDNNSSFFKRRA
jgi:hypothetical protein